MDKYCYIDENGDKVDYYTLVNDNGNLCEEIKRLNNQLKKKDEVINKALGHIKVCTSSPYDFDNFLSPSETEVLLQILEDKEVE